MPLGEAIDDPTSNDDYVAQLLTSEAKDKSLKYSALGLQAYLPRRPTDRAPKPNTRFLKNILRDTDSHNAALKRKEAEESRERMRRLRAEKSSSSRSHREERSVHRDGDYRDRLSRDLRDEKSRSRRHRREYRDDSDSDREGSARHHRRHREEERSSRRTRDTSSHRSSRRDRDERSDRHHRHRNEERSRSPRASRPRDDRHKRREVERMASEHSRRRADNLTETQSTSDNESDPLEDIVGPLPASLRKAKDFSHVSSRGRGSYRINSSTIDSHFAHDYDPNLDVNLSDDEDRAKQSGTRRPVAGLMTEDDDWDMALEALRDRAEWRKKGEERLRVAGFEGEVVERWKKHPALVVGGTTPDSEGRIEDVKWAKKGEGREWDRGKVMNEDGVFDVKAQW